MTMWLFKIYFLVSLFFPGWSFSSKNKSVCLIFVISHVPGAKGLWYARLLHCTGYVLVNNSQTIQYYLIMRSDRNLLLDLARKYSLVLFLSLFQGNSRAHLSQKACPCVLIVVVWILQEARVANLLNRWPISRVIR